MREMTAYYGRLLPHAASASPMFDGIATAVCPGKRPRSTRDVVKGLGVGAYSAPISVLLVLERIPCIRPLLKQQDC